MPYLKSLSKQRKQIGSVWLFFFVPMLEFPYRPIYWVTSMLFTYRIGLHQATPLVFLFILVNWWVEKHQRFLFNVYKRFFIIFVTFFYVFNVFLFIFSGTFYIYGQDDVHCRHLVCHLYATGETGVLLPPPNCCMVVRNSWVLKIVENLSAPPRTPLWELTALPHTL